MNAEREPYNWPSSSRWRTWTREERISHAEALVAQAARQRAPGVAKGDLTGAQTLAQELLIEARKSEPLPHKGSEGGKK